MNPEPGFDAIVIGRGPSGSLIAKLLTDAGLKVASMDHRTGAEFERYHSACGECISARGASAVGLREDEIRNRISRFVIRWPGGRRTDIRADGFIIDRCRLIARLIGESEAALVDAKAIDVRRTSEGFEVVLDDGRSLRARYVVGADGAQSVVRRKLFGSSPEMKIPITMRIGAEAPAEGDAIVFDFLGGDRFYTWDFPSGGGSCVGGVSGVLDMPDGGSMSRVIPVGWVDPFVDGRALLIGDAGGFVNPISFGGLRIAFETARHAADAIISDDPERYVRWWRGSVLSDRRFMRLSEFFASSDPDTLAEFSRHLDRGLYPSGIISVARHPRWTWAYVGCLLSLKFGW